ncbi:MAG: BatD family protein [Alphaproteobacteria bacterium]|nr:BatD family protein [Alphaproteobacteria bacterium]
MMIYCAMANAGQLSATAEPKQVRYGDFVRLDISYEGDDAGTIQPDFGALQTDFSIYSTSRSLQSSYTNGIGRQKHSWILLLKPKKEGNLQIPAIQVGKEQTSPLEVKVYAAGQQPISQPQNNIAPNGYDTAQTQNHSQTKQNGNFWAELSVSNKNPYIQQAVNATLYVYDNKGLDFQQEPVFDDTDNWIIQSTGNPIVSTNHGQRVIAFGYVMIPQKSGKIAVPHAQIKGSYIDSTKTPVTNSIDGLFKMFEVNFDLNNLFAAPTPVLLETKPVDVNVRPVPEDYGNAWWLPATALRLNAQWADKQPVFKVGEAVTREISLIAAGVGENRIPELKLKNNSIWKQYPEKPQVSTTLHNNELITQAVTRVVYIPQKGGEQKIPEIKLRWYNTKTNHIETAVIPAETIWVAGEVESALVSEQKQLTTSPVSNTNLQKYKQQSFPEYDKAVNKSVNNLMQKIKTGALIVMAFIAGLLISFLIFRRYTPKEKNNIQNDSLKQIEHSLEIKDYRGLRDALLLWCEQNFPTEEIKNLDDLSAFIDSDEFRQQMQILNDNLYAGGHNELAAKIICESLKKKRIKAKKKIKQPLPDLYK